MLPRRAQQVEQQERREQRGQPARLDPNVEPLAHGLSSRRAHPGAKRRVAGQRLDGVGQRLLLRDLLPQMDDFVYYDLTWNSMDTFGDLSEVISRAKDELVRTKRAEKEEIEHKISEKIALEICARLPKNDNEFNRMLQSGYELARHMGWESVVENYVMKSLNKAVTKKHVSKPTAAAVIIPRC